MDSRLESPQSLVDRQQLDDRRPRFDEILERFLYLRKYIDNLVHQAERQLSSHDGRYEDQGRENIVGL